MLNIVIPMAGEGARFTAAGYKLPKPMIDVAGKPMIERVMDCLRPSQPHRFTLITREHLAFDDVDVICLDAPTQGAVDTLLKAQDVVGDGPVLVANCDQYLTDPIDDFLAAADGHDAAIITFNSTNPHHSYVKASGWLVTDIAEKRVISDDAVAGIYYFEHGRTLMAHARKVVRGSHRVNGEFYLSSVLASYIDANLAVVPYEVDVKAKHMLGTPEELGIFLDKVADDRVRL